ncbi:acyl-CoA dehydrogenase family protein [Streptomyces sp. NPDC094038]|uniref:acyl-CoA dehydrogenase family protein n=1 Tax=Streptomyces sp. NPDC094038 TaxID=3366055 RepID=UPI00380E16CA
MPDTHISPWSILRRSVAEESVASTRRADAQIAWLRDYAARRLNSKIIDERRCIPPYVALDFGNEGLFGPLIETRYGGTALRFADLARVLEQLGAIDVGLATWIVTSVFPGTRPLSAYGTEELKAEWLPLLAAGRTLGAYAQTEVAAGSDFTSITTHAHISSEGWRLNGAKHWIGNGSWAGVVTVVAQLVDSTGEPADIITLAVPTASRGVTMGAEHLSSGLRGMVQSRLQFDDVIVPKPHLLGGEQSALVAVDSMTTTRFALVAVALGAMKRILQIGYRFASRRRVAGGMLGERAATLVVLGEIAAHIEIAEALVHGLADRFDLGQPLDVEPVAAVKVLVTEWAVQAADRLVQLLGGRGYDEANNVGQLYRDLRVYRIFEGATEVLTDFLGGRTLSQPEYMEKFLCLAPDVADQLRFALADLADREVTSHKATIDRELRRSAAGTAFAWALVSTELRNHPKVSALATMLTADRFQEALASLRDCGRRESAVPSFQELADTVARYVERIGDIEQAQPGADATTDALLTRQIPVGGAAYGSA